MKRLLRAAIGLYPARWQRRYGQEVEAVLDDVDAGWATLFDLVRGAVAVRLTSRAFTGRERSLALADYPEYWEHWAAHWSRLERGFFDASSVDGILAEARAPVLVVGAGQGLLVDALRQRGVQCHGSTSSARMAGYARRRRNITLTTADGRYLPFRDGACGTVVSDTGFIDFVEDEGLIHPIVEEMRRVAGPHGRIFIAFWRLSPGVEAHNREAGLLVGTRFLHRETMRVLATALAAGAHRGQDAPALTTTTAEESLELAYRQIFCDAPDVDALVDACPEAQCYRTADEIHQLFDDLELPLHALTTLENCHLARLQ